MLSNFVFLALSRWQSVVMGLGNFGVLIWRPFTCKIRGQTGCQMASEGFGLGWMDWRVPMLVRNRWWTDELKKYECNFGHSLCHRNGFKTNEKRHFGQEFLVGQKQFQWLENMNSKLRWLTNWSISYCCQQSKYGQSLEWRNKMNGSRKRGCFGWSRTGR